MHAILILKLIVYIKIPYSKINSNFSKNNLFTLMLTLDVTGVTGKNPALEKKVILCLKFIVHIYNILF